MFNVVTFVLNKFPDPAVVVTSPPLTAISPAEVILPLPPATEKFVPERSFAPNERAVTIVGSDTSIAVVTPLVPDEVILKPIGRIRSASALSIRTIWFGSEAPTPSARMNSVPAVDPVAVVMMNRESVAVSANVNEISRPSDVVIVFPPS